MSLFFFFLFLGWAKELVFWKDKQQAPPPLFPFPPLSARGLLVGNTAKLVMKGRCGGDYRDPIAAVYYRIRPVMQLLLATMPRWFPQRRNKGGNTSCKSYLGM